MKLLDLFCGQGGASMGYSRAGFKIVGVDILPQPLYPFEFIQASALEFDIKGFDVIHASPPCQAYTPRWRNRENSYPQLIEPIREKLINSGAMYIIENIPGAPLINGRMLCGSMFGLGVLRHRIFETNWGLNTSLLKCEHKGTVAAGDYAGVYGYGPHGRRHGKQREGRPVSQPDWQTAMGVDWMDEEGLKEAIPPAYTQFIGLQLRRTLEPRICLYCGKRFLAQRSTKKYCSTRCRVYWNREYERKLARSV